MTEKGIFSTNEGHYLDLKGPLGRVYKPLPQQSTEFKTVAYFTHLKHSLRFYDHDFLSIIRAYIFHELSSKNIDLVNKRFLQNSKTFVLTVTVQFSQHNKTNLEQVDIDDLVPVFIYDKQFLIDVEKNVSNEVRSTLFFEGELLNHDILTTNSVMLVLTVENFLSQI